MKTLAKIFSALFIALLLAAPSIPRAYADDASTTPSTPDGTSDTSSSTPQIEIPDISSSTPDTGTTTTDTSDTSDGSDSGDTSSSTPPIDGTTTPRSFSLFQQTPITPDPVTVHLDVEGADSTLYDGDLTVTACPELPGSDTSTVSAYCALQESGLRAEWDYTWGDPFLASVNGEANDDNTDSYWTWFSNLNYLQTAPNRELLSQGDDLLVSLGRLPLAVTVSNTSPTVGSTTTVTVTQFGFDSNFNSVWTPAASSSIVVDGQAFPVDANGEIAITATSTTPFTVQAEETGYLTTSPITITPVANVSTTPTDTARIAIFDNGVIATTTTVSIPSPSAPEISILADDGNTYTVPADSALGLVATLDQRADEFSLSDIANSPGLGLYVKCVDVPTIASSSVCDAWQYAVNDFSPFDAMGDHIVSSGDTIDLYAGNLRQTSLSSSTVAINTPFTATVTQFDPTTGTYLPAPGFTIGVTQYDPANPFTPIEIATSTSDASGSATFSIANAGPYGVGIAEDYYYPLTSLTIASSTTSNSGGNSGGGSGDSSNTSSSFDTSAAFSYLQSRQNTNGSFSADVYTDWSAFAFALSDAPSGARSSLTNYLKTASPALSSATDYERHLMALMALGINPYSGATKNYVSPLVAMFDGTKIGTKMTDDIFAILPLLHAGYSTSDPIIQKTAAYAISQQHSDGSWDGGVDTTAAAIQELSPVASLPGVSSAIAKARTYLKDQEGSDGSIGDDDSTSWSLQAIAALGDSPSNWSVGTATPLTYLASKQQPDGSVNSGSENASAALWSTIYALPAAEGKTWNALLSSFSIPSTEIAGASSGTGSSATSTATTTDMTMVANEAASTGVVSPQAIALPTIAARHTVVSSTPKAPQTKNVSPVNDFSTTSASTANTDTNNLTASAAGTPMAVAIAHAIEHFFAMIFGGIASLIGHLF